MKFALLTAAAYLLGSVPFGVLIAGLYGKDLSKIGSGNIGATNLSRALGKKWGYLCFALDLSKGLIPMLIAGKIVKSPPDPLDLLGWLLVGLAAILGHIFPIYLKFKGGKGVATSFGVALGLWPYFSICAAIAVTLWVIVVLISRIVSLASVAAVVAFPLALVLLIAILPHWKFGDLWPLLIAAVAIPVIVVVRHRRNIIRIIAGTESRISRK